MGNYEMQQNKLHMAGCRWCCHHLLPFSRRVCRLRLRLRPLRRLITRLRFCRRQRQQCRHLRRPFHRSRRHSVISQSVVVIIVIFMLSPLSASYHAGG